MLLGEIITRGATEYPERVALIFRDQPITYGELGVAVQRMAAGLVARGIKPGDRVALLLPNCPPFIVAYYAVISLGAEVVPANPLLKPNELAYIWGDASIVAVVTAGPLLANVFAAKQSLPTLRDVICITPAEEIGETPEPVLFWKDLLATGAQQLATSGTPTSSRGEKECAVIIYTSGTTGHPKGAMLSHFNLSRNIEMIQAVLPFNERDRFLTVLPLFHSFAGTVCMHTSLAAGCCSILMEGFHPARTMEAIERLRATIFCGVPAMFHAILNLPPEAIKDYSSLRVFVSGGAPLPVATLEALEARFGIPVMEGDGPTECSPATSINPLEGVRKAGSVGPPLPGVEIAIHDDHDNPLPSGEIGEIVVRGDNVMLGYLNQPEATAEAMANGWYHTGDLGYMDADDYVYIVDRKKDMIITAGFNVYPREIEEVLFQHPGVAEAAVIGMPDAVRGEEVVAVVVKRTGQEPTEKEILAHCRALLANYKVPRNVLFRDSLPKGGTGKVVKRLLKKELEQEVG